jgi:phage shock protein A
MNLFRRIFKVGEAEAHSAIDKLEDPIKMTEQGIRDMKRDLDNSLKSLAEVKAMAIRARNDQSNHGKTAKDYEQKAIMLLQKAQRGELDAAEADRLANEALIKKEEVTQLANHAQEERTTYEKSVAQLEGNVRELKTNIGKWENELKTLKARVRVSTATKNFNKQMAQIDSSSTVSMLERMKEKVTQEEALAEAYGDMANQSKGVDDEIDKALKDEPKRAASADLDALKKKLGMSGSQSDNI